MKCTQPSQDFSSTVFYYKENEIMGVGQLYLKINTYGIKRPVVFQKLRSIILNSGSRSSFANWSIIVKRDGYVNNYLIDDKNTRKCAFWKLLPCFYVSIGKNIDFCHSKPTLNLIR
ncbi:MAG: hypothetical protein QW752_03995 [Thermoplasmata archaeon]